MEENFRDCVGEIATEVGASTDDGDSAITAIVTTVYAPFVSFAGILPFFSSGLRGFARCKILPIGFVSTWFSCLIYNRASQLCPRAQSRGGSDDDLRTLKCSGINASPSTSAIFTQNIASSSYPIGL